MPQYEFRCIDCKKSFDRIVPFTERNSVVCPDCGEQVARVISSTNFSLAGNGWAKDGYSKSE